MIFRFHENIFFPKIAGLNLPSKITRKEHYYLARLPRLLGFSPTWFWRVHLVPPTYYIHHGSEPPFETKNGGSFWMINNLLAKQWWFRNQPI